MLTTAANPIIWDKTIYFFSSRRLTDYWLKLHSTFYSFKSILLLYTVYFFTFEMKRSRLNKAATSKCTASLFNDIEEIWPLFEDIFVSVTYDRVNPFLCIPFTNIRQISEAGVQRLISLYDNGSDINTDADRTELAFETYTPIVVPMVGLLRCHVTDHFKSKGLDYHQIEAKLIHHETWYGIIDGIHWNQAVRWLVSNRPGWANFKWFVTVLKGGASSLQYRKLVRLQNHRHS